MMVLREQCDALQAASNDVAPPASGENAPSTIQQSTAFKTAMSVKQVQLDQADATIRELRAALEVAAAGRQLS